jgi:hypothetical protein
MIAFITPFTKGDHDDSDYYRVKSVFGCWGVQSSHPQVSVEKYL